MNFILAQTNLINTDHWEDTYLKTKTFCEKFSLCMESKSKPKNSITDNIYTKDVAPGEYVYDDIVRKLV